MKFEGVRRDDQPINAYPHETPGSYWRVLDHTGTRVLDVHREGDQYWGGGPEQMARYAQNLTGGVWGVVTPNGLYGMLSIHTVREHEDGTISVRPGDGSSNSILISDPNSTYHGYIDHGVWEDC